MATIDNRLADPVSLSRMRCTSSVYIAEGLLCSFEDGVKCRSFFQS